MATPTEQPAMAAKPKPKRSTVAKKTIQPAKPSGAVPLSANLVALNVKVKDLEERAANLSAAQTKCQHALGDIVTELQTLEQDKTSKLYALAEAEEAGRDPKAQRDALDSISGRNLLLERRQKEIQVEQDTRQERLATLYAELAELKKQQTRLITAWRLKCFRAREQELSNKAISANLELLAWRFGAADLAVPADNIRFLVLTLLGDRGHDLVINRGYGLKGRLTEYASAVTEVNTEEEIA